jgi:DtxR family transcriptional regulator, Mn-dependent transcriptional regulator
MNNLLSESEEMYLATIARMQESGHSAPAPLSHLAEELAVLPVSANQMVRKLEDAGLVTYTPYKGVDLTEKGASEALRILRHRRLWEVFLVENLKYTPEEADHLACRLEHTLPPEAAERLADFLGNPAESPSNKPIPAAQAREAPPGYISLSQIALNTTAQVMEISADPVERSFLEQQGLRCGARLSLIATASSGDLLIRTDSGCKILMAAELTRVIRIKPDGPIRPD